MNKREMGTEYEKLAGAYLEQRGFRIVQYNFRVKAGEIDIVGYDKGVLVFVEVKYRKNMKYGTPAEAVTLSKQRKICKVAAFYRVMKKISQNQSIRYDVVSVCGEEITWYQNAFEQIGYGL